MSTAPRRSGRSCFEEALRLLGLGLWPVLIYPPGPKARWIGDPGKQPIGKAWGVERPTEATLGRAFKRNPDASLGLLLGHLGGVVDLEWDGDGADRDACEEALRAMLGGELVTMGWESSRGPHLLLRWDERFARYGKTVVKGEEIGLPGVELRIGAYPGSSGSQLQSVVPPSPTSLWLPDKSGTAPGPAREWNGVEEIAPPPDQLFARLDSHLLAPAPEDSRARTAPRPRASSPGRRTDAELAEDALGHLHPAGMHYSEWIRVGMALSQLGPEGLDIWDRWSQGDERYAGRSDLERHWKTFRAGDGGVKLGPLFERCKAEGWSPGGERADRKERRPRATAPAPTAEREAPEATGGDPPKGGGAPAVERPEIVLTTERHEVVDEVVKALAVPRPGRPGLYRRGPVLVTVVRNEGPRRGPRRAPETPGIVPVTPARCGEMVTASARLKRKRVDVDGNPSLSDAHPADWIIRGVLERGNYPGVPPLVGIVEAPTVREDGTILDAPGYDEETGLLYVPNAEFPAVPGEPTRADAEAAAAELLELVAEFPFKAGPHKAAWLAALLTVLARHAIPGPVPMFLFDANVRGSGKSLLCDLLALVATGRPMARCDHPDRDEEMAKVILSVVLGGDPFVLFDNVRTGASLGGPALDRALTAETFKGRILGQSRMSGELPMAAVFFATGNNLGLRGDLLRRAILCRLESPEEHPEERKGFRIDDIAGHVRDRRPGLVKAALTILRAHALAGYPGDPDARPMDYRAWCKVIRDAVWWAAGDDPAGGRDEARKKDRDSEALGALLAGLLSSQGRDGLPEEPTAGEALRAVLEAPAAHADLRAALAEFARRGDLPTPKGLGRVLASIEGRKIGGRVLRSRIDTGLRRWSVESVD